MSRMVLVAMLLSGVAPAAFAQTAAVAPTALLAGLSKRGFFDVEVLAAHADRFRVEASEPRGGRLRFTVDGRTGWISQVDPASPR